MSSDWQLGAAWKAEDVSSIIRRYYNHVLVACKATSIVGMLSGISELKRAAWGRMSEATI